MLLAKSALDRPSSGVFQQALPAGKVGHLPAISEAKLGQNVAHVVPDRVLGNDKAVGYLAVAGACRSS